MKIGTWLMAMCEPLVARVLLSLGFSVVSIVGMESVVGTLKAEFQGRLNALPVEMLNLFLYLGGGVGLGMLLGAFTTRMLLWSIQNSTKILGASPGS